jgi:hypothetical protein
MAAKNGTRFSKYRYFNTEGIYISKSMCGTKLQKRMRWHLFLLTH